ncbi:MAG TPA: cyclase family protein [Patescibacteria group bacterium]|nr:cyclase family protein [Patescibacteria group bacterium]
MTRVTVSLGDYKADLDHPVDISIPVNFAPDQLSAFESRPARQYAYKVGQFIGDVRQGGSCNCEVYHFSPHLHGTHTECVGHITTARIRVQDVLRDTLMPATLVTVTPVPAATCRDSYAPALRRNDMVITHEALKAALAHHDVNFLTALIVRTFPNDPGKLTRDYAQTPAPFFSNEAMEDIVALGVQHLLVDMPSLDRADDEGRLSNHRIFWEVGPGEKDAATPSGRTVTELIYIPDNVPNGSYVLNLQVSAFAGDAAPSRPVLYKVSK